MSAESALRFVSALEGEAAISVVFAWMRRLQVQCRERVHLLVHMLEYYVIKNSRCTSERQLRDHPRKSFAFIKVSSLGSSLF